MKKSKILVFVEWRLDLNFFLRFINGLQKYDCELFFLTNSLSLYLIGIQKRIKIFLCKKSFKKNIEKQFLNSTEVLAKLLTEDEAEILYQSVFSSGLELAKRNGVNLIFIGNGSSTVQIAMGSLAQHLCVPTLFFENSNLPGKTFVDPIGVNAASSLFNNINILNDYVVDLHEFKRFKKENFNSAKSGFMQKRVLPTIENPYIFLDYIGNMMLELPKSQNLNLFDRIFRKLQYNSLKIEDQKITSHEKYLFYPMQVSFDSQLLLNSDLSNIEAIEYSYDLSRKEKLSFVVKLHPKEKDAEVVKKILALRKEKNFKLSNSPTLELVRNCEMLVTINSTVGLEGLILGKDVVFLGKTFYKKLTPELIPKYICGYLLDFPYNSSDAIPAEKIDEMLKRIEVKSE